MRTSINIYLLAPREKEEIIELESIFIPPARIISVLIIFESVECSLRGVTFDQLSQCFINVAAFGLFSKVTND